jgi:(1->4)-alpha-D-glucan 1-alpha-D-glucosylmutase
MKAPGATYRLQLNAHFGFDAAIAILPYLRRLGVTHVYSSPLLQAARGSLHGYDVVDHSRPNAEMGGEAGHARYCQALGEWGLGQVLDIVPNHMAITGRENRWWWDVLQNGPASRYAPYFDVSWASPEAKLRNLVLMPILGDHYGRVLEAGQLVLVREGASFYIRYFEHVLPVAPRSLRGVLKPAAERADSDELHFIATAYGRLPFATLTDQASVQERHRDQTVLRAQLARLLEQDEQVVRAIDAEVATINADVDTLDRLLDAQNYRIAYWRTAGRELDYRRFFDINTLVGLRVEDAQVFADSHELLLRWVQQGVIDGLRVDHPDGLLDPEQYFARLSEATGGAWTVAEKILESEEELPPDWAVAGTTGYDFCNQVGGLFVDPAGEAPITELYRRLTGNELDYADAVHRNKLLVLREILAADVNRLAEVFVEVCERHRRHRDYTRWELTEALRELVACFPVYRSYVRAQAGVVRPSDEHHVAVAVAAAREHRPDLDAELFTFLENLLLLRVPGAGPCEHELVMRFQQLTGPAMAKGVEDTTFYRWNRFVALNEVGGDPSRFGLAPDAFHDVMRRSQERWPETMRTVSTHDTKRSGDVRARLFVLSEFAPEWVGFTERALGRLEKLWPNAPEGDAAFDADAAYVLLQALVGAWPLPAERAAAYMEKAAKEAKRRTSWVNPNTEYDAALRAFVTRTCEDAEFQGELARFVKPFVWPGRVNSLAQVLITLTAPGVPDIYQGSELWDLSLVDPDNRRPVDYALRQRLLDELPARTPAELVRRSDDGAIKLHVIHQALQLRHRRREAFGRGEPGAYRPLGIQGPDRERCFGFLRGTGVAVVVPRLASRALSEHQSVRLEARCGLPEGPWKHVFTGQVFSGGDTELRDVLGVFPVALLERMTQAAAEP